MSKDSEEHLGEGAFLAPDNKSRISEMTYGGALSFLRRRYSRDLTGVDVAVLGVPFDCATSYRAGARLGPRAVRAGSVQLSELLPFPFGFDPFDYLSVVDYGDVFFDFGYPQHCVEVLEAQAKEILDQGTSLLSIGGDHFITYPLLRAHAAIHGPISLIHFDAHCDTWEDDGDRLDHGSMFLRAANEGIVNPASSVQVGLRTHNTSRHGYTWLTAPWVHRHGVEATLSEIKRVVGDTKAYITFDIDCLDPAFAPGTGTPVSGGLSSGQAFEILRGLGDLNLIGMDVVEVAPAYDNAEITAIAAATLAHDYLCLLAMKAGAEITDPTP